LGGSLASWRPQSLLTVGAREMLSMQSLVIIQIGPVQEFIASARRSRDLWFGSWLLSELSKVAARTLVERNGRESLIFPFPEDDAALAPGSSLSVANRIVAVVEELPEEEGRAVRESVIKRLRELRDNAYGYIGGAIDRGVAERQVDDLLEYYFVSLPLPTTSEYSLVRTRLEAMMTARKVTRDFAPVTWGDHVPKSSLDGLRESVVPESVYDKVRSGQMDEKEIWRLYGVGKAERLCGVGLLKRHGRRGTEDRFLSTSHVAALSLLHRIGEAAKEDAAKYIQTLTDLGIGEDHLSPVSGDPHPVFGRYDGELLFQERLREFFSDRDARGRAETALREFLKKAAGDRRPLPYYGLLVADGDHIGRVIDNQKTIEDHRGLSRTLSQFTAKVPDVVAEHEGSLVYAGGDDVLAFLPLHTVLACTRELAGEFRKALAHFHDANGHSPTLSAGIAVSHHLEPLSDALELARNAEKIAKREPGKDALAITVSKRGGVDRTVAGRWGAIDDRLHLFVRLHRLEAIPDAAAYNLHDLSRRLSVPHNNQDYSTLQEATRVQAVRILRRKRARRGKEAIAAETLRRLEKLIVDGEVPVGRLADELIVARIFAEAVDLADLPLDEEVAHHANMDH
jgi:CRISPR-associated protein Cmr2